MRTHSLSSPLNTSTLRLIKGWHLLLVAGFVFLASIGFAAFLYGHSAAFMTPSLGTAQSFAILGGSTVTNTGPTTVSGDLGVWPGTAVTGFPPGTVTGGVIHANDAVALQAQSDVTIAYNSLAGLPCNTNLTGQDLGGLTLVPGVYCFNTSAQLTGALALDAQGDPNAVFVFQIGSTLVTASNASVQVINGAQNCNAFWQVGSSATLGTGTSFIGSILALASITLNTNAILSGRALARTGAVTMDNNAITRTTCAPLLAKSFSPPTIFVNGISQLTITLSNPNTIVASLTAPLIDTLPAGLLIAAPPNAANTCGGVATATAGGNTVTLTGGAIPAGNGVMAGTCTVTVNVIGALPGNYLNTLPIGALQTSNGSNTAPASAPLTVICPVIDTTITAPVAVCALSTGNAASVPNAGAGATYVWTITNGTITAGQGTPNITFTAGVTSPITLNVTVTTSPGCNANGSAQVIINANPTAAAGPDQTLCQTVPVPTVFTVTGTVTNAAPSWSVISSTGTAVANIVSPNAAATVVNVTGIGTVTLRLTSTSTATPSCGTAMDDVVLTVTTSATAAAGPDQTLCQTLPGPTVFTVSTTSGGTLQWSVFATTGSAAATIISPNSATTAVNVTGIGTVTLRLTATTTCGTATDDVVLTVTTNATAAAGPDQTLCQTVPGPTVFTVSSTTPGGTLQWSVFATTGTAVATIVSPNSATTAVNVAGIGTVTLRLTATTTCGTATDDVVLTVTTNATAAAGPDQTLCQTVPGPTVFTVSSTTPGGTLQWSVFATTGTATAIIVSPNSATTAVNVTGIGTVTLRLTSTTSCGTATDDVVLTVTTSATAAAGPDQMLCQTLPGPTVFTVSSTTPGGTLQWSVFATTGTATAIIVSPNSAMTAVNVTGIGTVTLRLTSTTNCGTATDDVVLTVTTSAAAAAGPDQMLCQTLPGPTVFTVSSTTPGGTLQWSVFATTGSAAAIIISPNSATTNVNVTGVGTVTLRLTSTTTCGTATDDVLLTVDTCPVDVCVVKTGSALVAYETGQFTYTLSIVNFGPGVATGVTVTDTLPAGVTLVSALPSQGACSGTATLICNLGNLANQATATIRLVVTLPMKSAGSVLCNTATVTSNQTEIAPANNTSTLCVPVEKVPPGPGVNLPPTSQVSATKSGSVLVFPYYTSDASNPSRTNTRISITNVENNWQACVHLFFVDGASCSVADSYLCLTPNQTTSFLMSDLDPGVSGYMVAVLVDCATGCPLNLNTLIGDEYVKLASGHAANLGAEAIAGLPGATALCDSNSSATELKFDGVMYNQLPRVLALDNLGSRADGNDTLLVINRIGGDLAGGAATLGTLFGLLYNDTENAYSFSFTAGCQFRGSLTDSFPRTTPRLTTVIPTGRSGWLKLWGANNVGLFGVALNFNPNAAANAGAFNGGHNLHKLTLTPAASITIPVFPPSC